MKRVGGILSVLFVFLGSTISAGGQVGRLTAPTTGKIQVAVLISDGVVMIDFAGPWEVFSDVMLHAPGQAHEQRHPFHLYTVAESSKPIRTSGGMRVVPDYSFDNAPTPNIVVVPAQSNDSPQVMAWINKMSKKSDVVMSVCTGAFLLAKSGVLNGKSATTHHDAYATLSQDYPKISVQRGKRYVRADSVVFTSGGLSSGIDLAFHIVDLYYGDQIAEETSRHMEYEGPDWRGDGSATVDFSLRGIHAELDNLSNKTFGNPSTEFSLDGMTIGFSFNGDPAYKGTFYPDKKTIGGMLLMSDGSTAVLGWTKVAESSTQKGSDESGSNILGDWKATLQTAHGSQDLVLHIRD